MRQIVLLISLSTCLAVASDHPTWKNLRARYLGLKTLSGTFRETICAANETTCREYDGTFAISVPSRYRIEVTEGMKQLFVSDSATLWIYLPSLKKVVKRPGGGFAPVMAFLEPVLDTTAEVEVTRDSTGIYVINVLTGDEMSAMNDLVLELNETGTIINGFSFEDGMGQKIHFSFYDQQWNTKLSPSLFKFTPPKGVPIEEE
jgi:outer membrane lipoprotein carrier protein